MIPLFNGNQSEFYIGMHFNLVLGNVFEKFHFSEYSLPY